MVANIPTFFDQRVLVLGAGLSGVAASELLQHHGAAVLLVDEGRPQWDEERLAALRSHGIEICEACQSLPSGHLDFAVVSPGVPTESHLLQQLRAAEVPLISELELGARLVRSRLVGVTGTNGKTTTTRLVETVLRLAGFDAIAAGNIGLPLSRVALNEDAPDWVALEVSSFQLEGTETFRPAIGVLLNLASDHLDRYPSLESYFRTKLRLFRLQGSQDWAIVQLESKEIAEAMGFVFPGRVLTFSSQNPKADVYYGRGYLVSRIPGWSGVLYDCREGHLVGRHNAENLMASFLVGYVLGVSPSDLRLALGRSRPEPHRFTELPQLDGVRVIEDSKSTNPASLQAALETASSLVEDGGRLWLLAGGDAKGLDFESVKPMIARHVEGCFLFGADREKLGAVFSASTRCLLFETLEEVVVSVRQRSAPGDVVLFSPGCASFDQFRNYRERGIRFRDLMSQAQAPALPESNRKQAESVTRRILGSHPESAVSIAQKNCPEPVGSESIYEN